MTNMSNPAISRVIYAALVVMNLIIGAFILEVGKGTVPIPDDLKWTVPILLAALNGISLFLPRWGGERTAQQVDRLKAQGVARADMIVVDRSATEAAPSPDPDLLAQQIVARIRQEMGGPEPEPERVRVVPTGRG